MQSNAVTSKMFRGVFAADQIPDSLDPLPAGCIINTDPQNLPGHHWVALYQTTPDVLETFDSYGKDLHFYSSEHFSQLAKRHRIISQMHQLQSPTTTVCGQYCMFFLLRRASMEPYSHIIHLFTDNKSSNDSMVCQYVNHHFDLQTEVQDLEFLASQMAKTIEDL